MGRRSLAAIEEFRGPVARFPSPIPFSPRQFAALAIAALARLLTRLRVNRGALTGLPQSQRIYYFNHTSHLDTILMWSALPSALRLVTRPLAAQDYWLATPFRKFCADRLFNAIFVSREAAEPRARSEQILKIAEEMGSGYSLMIAPEGTRSPEGGLQPFKSGLFYLSQARPDVDLVPVYLENVHKLLPKGAFFPHFCSCGVSFGAPMPGCLPGEAKQSFLGRAEQALRVLASQDWAAGASHFSVSPQPYGEDSADAH